MFLPVFIVSCIFSNIFSSGQNASCGLFLKGGTQELGGKIPPGHHEEKSRMFPSV